jgi:4'-phosphopantetheinyl transferase
VKCDFGEVHIWKIELNCAASSVARLELALSPEERSRSAGFLFPELRTRWTVVRGALRQILAEYLQTVASSLMFHLGPNGKPGLAGAAENISFNLSHTRDLALIAITRNGRIGIDAEEVRGAIEIEALSRHFFATGEADEIMKLSGEQRIAAFFACWTRKESFLKALGVGLSVQLRHFEVAVRADQPAQLISVNWDNPSRWSLQDIGEPGIAAALTVEGPTPTVCRFNFAAP